jgi:Raf kinase inhibitor-like YbhB/YbcL family protein
MALSILGRVLRSRRAGEGKLAWYSAPARHAGTFALSSAAFQDGGAMPARYAASGENLSPPLAWNGQPAASRELILIVEDCDAPLPRPFVHCVARLDPALNRVPEGALAADARISGVRLGRGGLRHFGYAGPRPVPGHGPHRYVFQMFALDRALDQPQGIGPRALLQATDGHVIARARLTGTFEAP